MAKQMEDYDFSCLCYVSINMYLHLRLIIIHIILSIQFLAHMYNRYIYLDKLKQLN